MANSGAVVALDDILASQYNNLRLDVLDTSSGHLHDGTNARLHTNFGIGAAPSTSRGLLIDATVTSAGVTQYGAEISPTLTSAATTSGAALYGQLVTAAAAYTMVSGQGLLIDVPSLGASSAITSQYGVRVLNQGAAGVTNAYGLHVAAQSGAATINYGVYVAGGTPAIYVLAGGATIAGGNLAVSAGTVTGTALVPSGLTGATTASRYVGGTTTGAPGSGTFSTGDYVVAQDAAIFICTAGGTPGTWVSLGSGAAAGSLTGTALATQIVTFGTAANDTVWTGQSWSFTGANSTDNTVFTVTNSSDAAAASHSIVDVAVGGTTSTGDPQIRWTIPGGTSWYAGADNSAADVFIIGTGTAVGTNGFVRIGSGGTIGHGTTMLTYAGFYGAGITLTGDTDQVGISSGYTFGSGATSSGKAFTAQVNTAIASFTMTNAYGLFVPNASKGAGSTITNSYGINVVAQTAGGTLNIGIHSGSAITIGTAQAANMFDDASNGAGSTAMYIGNAVITVASDARLKADIQDTDVNWLEELSKLRVRSYLWNDPSDRDNRIGGRHLRGRFHTLVAQEVLEDAPAFRYTINAPEINCPECRAGRVCIAHRSFWNVDPWGYVGPLISANQELRRRVLALEARGFN